MYCRLCNSNIEEPFLSLGNSPLANSYISKDNLYKKEEYYPLNMYLCNKCKLVQVDDFVTSDIIFSPDYAYYSSYSTSFLEHCKNYVDMIVSRFNLNQHSRVIEIGSNDGYLLQYFKPYNIKVLGVDPAREASYEATKKGIETHRFFFNYHYVKQMLHPDIMDLIIANNVLAHNPNLNEFVQSMKYILKSNGVITVEFPHLLNIIKYNQFDTIYHEHFSYLSLTSVNKLFKNNGLTIFNVEEIPTHGGSLRIYAKHNDDIMKGISQNVENILTKESEFGLNNINTYINFKHKVEETKRNILDLLISLKGNNSMYINKNHKIKTVAYGAPAKANTLLNYCGIRTDFIDFTVDMNPNKQGKYLPGTHIPIFHPDKIKENKPDYIVILPWNIKDEIMNQLSYVKEWNAKFITLIPEPEIHST